MNQKAMKNVLSLTEEGDAAMKGYVDSKCADARELDMRFSFSEKREMARRRS